MEAPSLVSTSPGAGSFALDVQSLDAMRRAARQSPEDGLRQVAKQFEALFVGMMLKSMREATPDSTLFDSTSGKLYQSMLDQQLAQSLSGRGLKLADALFAQLRRNLPVADNATGGATPAAATALPAPPASPAPRTAAGAAPAAASTVPIRPARADGSPLEALRVPPAAQGGAARAASAVADRIGDFVARIGNAAKTASEASGVPAALIAAQAALESGWGQREIRGDDGARSFNLFGIKADRSWKGAVAETTTSEYVNGAWQHVKARFRAYASYEEAFADYARFLAGNPRYAGVVGARDATEAAHRLHAAGYATDPDYAGKLVRIMQKLF
jgi:peptidoglycan hydrolase FlgJ